MDVGVSMKTYKHKLNEVNCWIFIIFRASNISLNNVWTASLEDNAALRASDVKSPLPLASHFHSTPNYWQEKPNKQFSPQLNQSHILHSDQNTKFNSNNTSCDSGFDIFSPLAVSSANWQSRMSERSSISSFTSQSSQHSSDTDSFLELQSITDNMEKCNYFNNNYMLESQLACDSLSKPAFQPFADDMKLPQSSFRSEQSSGSQRNETRRNDLCLSSLVAKGALPFDSQTRNSFQENGHSKMCGNNMNLNSVKTSFQSDIPNNLTMKSEFCYVNPKPAIISINSEDVLQNCIKSANTQTLYPADLKPDFPAENSLSPVANVQNQMPTTSTTNLLKPQEQKPFNSNIFQPVRVLTRPQPASSLLSDQGWSNPSTPGSLPESVTSCSEKTASDSSITVPKSVNQKHSNMTSIAIPSKVAPQICRHSFPLGVQPRFGPVGLDQPFLPVDSKILLEPVTDKRYSMSNFVGGELIRSSGTLERSEERVPLHTVPPPQFLKYPTKIPIFVPTGIPQPTLPGNIIFVFHFR